MLTQMFKNVLLMSVSGSVLAFILLSLSPLTRKKFGTKWQYYIWITVLISMLLPIHLVSLPKNYDKTISVINENLKAENEKVTETKADVVKDVITVNFEKISVPKIELSEDILSVLAKIWIFGVVVTALTKIIKYNLFLRTVCKNSIPNERTFPRVPKRIEVRKTDMLDAPLVVGLFKVRLFLPKAEMSDKELEFVLMHELTHCKRHDVFYKWVVAVTSCVHWFNPLIYVVSEKVDEECEISCDFCVSSEMSTEEKKDYMNVILSLLEKEKDKRCPLTTQMANGKKTIKRRFNMIRNGKKTGKIVTAASTVTALIMMSLTVFATGVLADITKENYYTVEIFSCGEKVPLEKTPFIENENVYVPLRETLEKVISNDEGKVDVKWDNGEIDVAVLYFSGQSGLYNFKIGGNFMRVEHVKYEDFINNSREKKQVSVSLGLKQPPILRNSVTYVTLENVNYMLYGFTNKRDENNSLRKLSYIVYNRKTGKTAEFVSYPTYSENEDVNYYEYNSPEYIVQRFFRFFEDGYFDTMKNYCTEECINTFFNGDNVFGMKRATLVDVSVDPLEYTKSSNGINVFVSVVAEPGEISVFDKDVAETSFYVVLERQEDGKYLIDGFQNGI